MKLLHAMLVAVFMVVASTSAHAGKMTKSKEPLVVAPDKANIVFMRPGKFVGAAIAVPVFDVTAAETTFVGLVEAGSKVAYSVPAGEHLFMTTVFGGDAGVRFYKANVEAGKTYYFYAHIIEGLWGLEPVRSTMGEDLAGWDKGTTLTVNSPKTIAWAEENKASVAEKRALKPEAIADANTLRAEDGR
jgi:hypothetical protein